MIKPLYSLLFVIVIFTTTAVAQRSGNTRRPLPQATPSPTPVERTTETPQTNLTQQIEDLSRQIESGMTNSQKRTIAVVEFVDLNGNVSNFGRFLAEELITRLYQKKFKVIERQLLNKVIAEQKLSLSGAVDQSTAQKLGRILGVDSIASGTITDLGDTLRVNARLVSTETGELFAVASTSISKDKTVINLMNTAGTTSPANKMAESSSTSSTRNEPSPSPSVKRRDFTQKVESRFFTFELKQCRLSGTSVICDLVITNNDIDRYLGCDANRSSMYDDAGNGSRGTSSQIANAGTYDNAPLLVSGVPVRARITFEGISPQAKRITLLKILYITASGRQRDDFELEFRNVPLVGTSAGMEGEMPTAFPNNRETEQSEMTASREAGAGSNRGYIQRKQTFRVYPGKEMIDTGIEVEPGMRIEVMASENITTSGESVSGAITRSILTGILNGRNSRPTSPSVRHSIGPNALIAKIRYSKGGILILL
jgi:TolB-like protein